MSHNADDNITYEPDADILMYELNNKPIDYAKEAGNFVVHFTKDNKPVLVEILQARSFLLKTKNLVSKTKTAVS